MAEKLLIILVNTNPSNPSELDAPLMQATAAAAMEYDVEIIFSGRSAELAVKGVAEGITFDRDHAKTVYDAIKEAHEAGVKFRVCTPASEQWGDNLIPEIEEVVGGAYLICEAMDEGTVTFTY
jgi:predicted peroxiredoxin